MQEVRAEVQKKLKQPDLEWMFERRGKGKVTFRTTSGYCCSAAMVRWVAESLLPFNIVQDPGFQVRGQTLAWSRSGDDEDAVSSGVDEDWTAGDPATLAVDNRS